MGKRGHGDTWAMDCARVRVALLSLPTIKKNIAVLGTSHTAYHYANGEWSVEVSGWQPCVMVMCVCACVVYVCSHAWIRGAFWLKARR